MYREMSKDKDLWDKALKYQQERLKKAQDKENKRVNFIEEFWVKK